MQSEGNLDMPMWIYNLPYWQLLLLFAGNLDRKAMNLAETRAFLINFQHMRLEQTHHPRMALLGA